MCQLTATYNKKKARALERGIGFVFTKEEFGEFLALKGTVNCFYTNHPFGAHGSATEATIERIDDMRPYGPDNCVWVTKAVNHLKQTYMERKSVINNLP